MGIYQLIVPKSSFVCSRTHSRGPSVHYYTVWWSYITWFWNNKSKSLDHDIKVSCLHSFGDKSKFYWCIIWKSNGFKKLRLKYITMKYRSEWHVLILGQTSGHTCIIEYNIRIQIGLFCHTGNISFVSVLFANIVFAEHTVCICHIWMTRFCSCRYSKIWTL